MRDVTTIPPLRADRRVPYGADNNQFIDIFGSRLRAASATVMMIHGGFWRARYDLEHTSHLCDFLARNGMNAANIEYRRVGNSGGGWPGTFEDVKQAFALVERIFPGSPIIVIGHSAGGHLALRLACEAIALTGVVALAPVAVLRTAYQLHLSNDAVVEFLGGTPTELPHGYDEACPSLHPLSAPAMLVHGTEDDVVPISQSRDYVEARRGDPVHLLELPGVGHMELIDPDDAAIATIAAAITDLLR